MLRKLICAVAPLILRVLGWTWSVRVVNPAPFRDGVARGKPVIAALWHEILVPVVYFFRDRRAWVVISRSRDGELMARVGRRMGYRAIRGSSTRGGREALAELSRVLRDGGQVALFVDGPKGPARVPKLGCVLAARRTGVPIVPIACRVQPSVRIRSWDRTFVPLPFSRIVVSFGEPIFVSRDATPEECEVLRARVREALERAERAAYGRIE